MSATNLFVTSRRLAAAVAITLALLAAIGVAATEAAASGEIEGDLPTLGYALVVWGGGDVAALQTAAEARGCDFTSVWTFSGGTAIGYRPGAPAFVNAAWTARFPNSIPANQPLLVGCGLPPSLAVGGSFVAQGGVIEVNVQHASDASATLLGRTFALDSDGVTLTGYVAVGTDDPLGTTTLTITATDDAGRVRTYQRTITVAETNWPVDYITLPPPDPNAPPPPPDEQPRLDAIYASAPTPRLWRNGWISPFTVDPAITDPFGTQRSYNGGPVGGHHGGVDYGASAGTPILATNDGTVIFAEETYRRGNLVVIDHGSGIVTAYGHMSSMAVAVGEIVTQGEVIGHVGSTGLATGPHLHWEVSVGGVLVDGLRWLEANQ